MRVDGNYALIVFLPLIPKKTRYTRDWIMALRFGEIVLIEVQFHQTQGSKIRPATVVLDSGDEDFVAAPVTSRPSATEFDLVLVDWRSAGLNVPSTVRLHKIAVLS